MDKVLEFLQIYWKDILYLIISLVVVIITLLKRKNVVNVDDSIHAFILDLIPELIAYVEVPGNGSTKKQLVMNYCENAVQKKYGVFSESIRSFISDAIERIMVCPQRKGVIYEEKSKQVRR